MSIQEIKNLVTKSILTKDFKEFGFKRGDVLTRIGWGEMSEEEKKKCLCEGGEIIQDANEIRYHVCDKDFVDSLEEYKEDDKPTKQEGTKFDDGKPRWELLPCRQIEEVVKVLTKGAVVHGNWNWQRVKPFRMRYFGALMRHAKEYSEKAIEKKITGYENLLDKDTKQHILANLICDALFLMWGDMNHDDKVLLEGLDSLENNQ